MPNEASFRIFNPSELHKPVGYSHVAEITSGKLIYFAGQVALDPSGNLVGGNDFRAQTAQVFANLGAALKAAGTDFHHVVKFTCFSVEKVDPAQIAAFREIRDAHVNT